MPFNAFYIMKQLFTGSFLLLTLFSFGQTRFQSLQEVLDYADQHAVAIQNARLQELSNTSKKRQADLSLLPSVNAGAGFTDNITLQPTLVPAQLFNPAAPEGTFSEYTFGRKYLYNTGLQVHWDAVNFQKWFNVQTAEAQSVLGKAKTSQARFDTYQQLANTYYAILLSEKFKAISAENLTVTDSLYRSAGEKYRSGLISEEVLNSAQLQYLQAVKDQQNLTANAQQLQRQLQAQLGLSSGIELSEAVSDQEINLSHMPAVSSLHPDEAVQQAQVHWAENQLRQMRAMHYPTLSLDYQYNYTWATDGFIDFSQANQLPQQYLGLRLSIPIFNGSQTREKVQQSEIALRQQRQLLDHTRNAVQQEDAIQEMQLRQQAANLSTMQEMLALQTANDRHVANRYEGGIISLDERLDRFQDLLALQHQYMQSLSDYYISFYQRYIRQIQW